MNLNELLWKDEDFLRSRALEQLDYMLATSRREELDETRKAELINSALIVFKRFEDRLKELSKQKKCTCKH